MVPSHGTNGARRSFDRNAQISIRAPERRSSHRGQIVQIWCFKPKTDDETRGYGRGRVSRVLGNAAPRLTARPCDVRGVWNSFWTISPPRHERRSRADGRRRSRTLDPSRPSRAELVQYVAVDQINPRWARRAGRSRERGDSVPAPALAAPRPRRQIPHSHLGKRRHARGEHLYRDQTQ